MLAILTQRLNYNTTLLTLCIFRKQLAKQNNTSVYMKFCESKGHCRTVEQLIAFNLQLLLFKLTLQVVIRPSIV